MTGKLCALTVVNCTPDQLRLLAMRLELKWRDAKLGDDVPSETVYLGTDEVRFVIDQEEMHSEERERKRNAK
jgi:hypothetical protein